MGSAKEPAPALFDAVFISPYELGRQPFALAEPAALLKRLTRPRSSIMDSGANVERATWTGPDFRRERGEVFIISASLDLIRFPNPITRHQQESGYVRSDLQAPYHA